MKGVKSRINGTAAALAVVLAALGIAYTAVASAASPSEDGTGTLVSPWPEPETAVTPGNTASLTNDVGAAKSEPGAQLQIGLVLIGLALLALAYGVAARRRQHSGGRRLGIQWAVGPKARRAQLEAYQGP